MSAGKPIGRAVAKAVWRRRANRLLIEPFVLSLLISVGGVARAVAAAQGDYTLSQADAGRQVFSQHCAQCHGSNLEGEAGPALAGPKFASDLAYSKMSAQQLFEFITTQMPADAPGSLTKQQYEQAFAYILAQNGYPAGSMPLNEDTLGRIKLLPYPGSSSRSALQRTLTAGGHSRKGEVP